MFMSKMENQVQLEAPNLDKKGPPEKKTTTGMGSTGLGGGSGANNSEFHYEAIADLSDFLLSVYELTGLSE